MSMRIRYVGFDQRPRVSVANSIKFLEDGFKSTDKPAEYDEDLRGPLLVVHVSRGKGGRRLTLQPPEGFNMETAMLQMLEKGWLDLGSCAVKAESLY